MLANNSFSLMQMMALKNNAIRDFLGLAKPPPSEEIQKKIESTSASNS